MNPTKQLWALVKGQFAAYPGFLVISLIFCFPLIWMHGPHPSLDLLIASPNLFLVGIYGCLMLAPEFLAMAPQGPSLGYGTDYLLTRALNRNVVARARTAFFLFIVLIGPAAMLLIAQQSPGLNVAPYSREVGLLCLSHIPGSSAVTTMPDFPNLVFVPNGKVLFAAWHLWSMLAVAAAVQILIYAIHRFKYRRFVFWLVFSVLAFGPLAAPYIPPLTRTLGAMSFGKQVFLSFAANQPLYWLLILVAAFAGQLWCEWRFSRLEY